MTNPLHCVQVLLCAGLFTATGMVRRGGAFATARIRTKTHYSKTSSPETIHI
jgi:hypothetical protein